MAEYKYEILPGEYWWGGTVDDAYLMPFSAESRYSADLTHNMSYNQVAPLFLSSFGRYIWADNGYKITFADGCITVECDDPVDYCDGAGARSLRGAFLAAKKHFPSDGRYPDERMFRVPQYCTWIELLKNQTQEGVLNYARSILDSGMPAGEIIIDNGWQCDFGVWDFNRERFPDPKEMCRRLHEMGFRVILWVVPYVSENTAEYKYLCEKDALIKSADGGTLGCEWWEGTSAVLDFSAPEAVEWFYAQCDRLTDSYGIDGFKQDGGDAMFLPDNIVCREAGCNANRQSELYALSALRFRFNELRACFKCGGRGLAQRVADRHHTWDIRFGLGSLIPNTVLQGLLGYPFVCPDMAGGGLARYFDGVPADKLDKELFVRSCQCSALMPMMQLSYAFWRAFDRRTVDICIGACMLHADMHRYIMSCVKRAAEDGEPIVRNMAYAFGEGETIVDQFMLGDEYLVAPVLEKGVGRRRVTLFSGKWENCADGAIYDAGEYEFDAPLDRLLYFKRVRA